MWRTTTPPKAIVEDRLFRFGGLDNSAYYRLVRDNPRNYLDQSGAGNSMNVSHPAVLRMIMDSMRYWVTEMHVDGFRFDQAADMAGQFEGSDGQSAFFDLIHQDPVISQVKLIAGPWDSGEGRHLAARAPATWSERNINYRNDVRDFWLCPHEESLFPDRFCGSASLFEGSGRPPWSSVNYITSHAGFTLIDLVSYSEKHNEANLEDNQDGELHNHSWNCGTEGPTDDEEINELRSRMCRNLMATLLLSQGVPLLVAGDEMGRTQQGNNNAFCQDNELSWLDWELIDGYMAAFTARLVNLRWTHPVFRRRRWFDGRVLGSEGVADLGWLHPDGTELDNHGSEPGFARSIAYYLNGEAIGSTDSRGAPIVDDSFMVVFNASHQDVAFVLPPERFGKSWVTVVDTGDGFHEGSQVVAGETFDVSRHSLVLLRAT